MTIKTLFQYFSISVRQYLSMSVSQFLSSSVFQRVGISVFSVLIGPVNRFRTKQVSCRGRDTATTRKEKPETPTTLMPSF